MRQTLFFFGNYLFFMKIERFTESETGKISTCSRYGVVCDQSSHDTLDNWIFLVCSVYQILPFTRGKKSGDQKNIDRLPTVR